MVYAESSSLAIRLIDKQSLERKYVKQDYNDLTYALIPIIAHMFQNTDFCLDTELHLDATLKNSNYYVKLNSAFPFEEICKDKSNKWIVIFVRINFEGEGISHQTVLIINRKEKTIKYFEPNGPATDWHENVEDLLYKYMEIHFPKYRFIYADELCPDIGPQGKAENSPFCVAYSLFLVWTSLVDPDYSSDKLIAEILKENETEIAILIEKFIQFIYRYAEENGIFDFYELYNSVIGIIMDILAFEFSTVADKYLISLDVKGMQSLHDYLDSLY